MYDLLIKGGRIIDPAQNLNEISDLAIQGDRIALLAKDIHPSEAVQVIDAIGNIVTPGLIDIHAHVYKGVIKIGLMPDDAGVNYGVTTVVDAGSAGEAIFNGFPDFIIPASLTTVYCFLHLNSLGLSLMPEMRSWEEVNLEETAATIENNRHIIKGIKLRLLGRLMVTDGIRAINTAKKLASDYNLPLAVHIGDVEKKVSADLTAQCLSLLDSGDIACHIYTGQWGTPLRPDGTVLPEMISAMKRGVIMDVSPGMFNFSYDVARKSMSQGIIPTTISTDLTLRSLSERVFSLTVTMSRLMALGLTLEQVVAMTTINPARILSIYDKVGSLKVDSYADVSILKKIPGRWGFEDSEEQILDVNELLIPTMTVKGGRLIPAQKMENLPCLT